MIRIDCIPEEKFLQLLSLLSVSAFIDTSSMPDSPALCVKTLLIHWAHLDNPSPDPLITSARSLGIRIRMCAFSGGHYSAYHTLKGNKQDSEQCRLRFV